MAKLDLTGLMTGLPTDQDLRTQGQARAAQIQGGGLGSNLARGIASRAPQREEMMRQGLGGMFGVDTRTGDQQQTARMQQALSGLKLDTPEGLMQLAQIHKSTGNTDAALKAIAAARSLENAEKTSLKEQERFELTRDDKKQDLALAERRVEVTEASLKARNLDTTKVERYDENTGKNVIDFVLTNNPTTIVRTVPAPQDPIKLYASVQQEMLKNSTLISNSQRRGAAALKVATLLEKAQPTAGVFGSLDEAIKAAGGTQDDASEARTAAENLVQGEAIASLPQGPATDKDIELARRGQPPANASPEYLASYARGIVKLADREARYYREKNAWLSLYQNPRGFDSSQLIKGSERTLESFSTGTELAILKAARNSIGTPQEAADRALFEKEFGFDIKLFDEDLELARKVIADVEKDR